MEGANASEKRTAANVSGGRPSTKRIHPRVSAVSAAPASDMDGWTRRSTRLDMKRLTPCSSRSRSTHSSGGGMSVGAMVMLGPPSDTLPRSPMAATTSRRCLPSWTRLARAVVTDRPARMVETLNSPGQSPDPGLRKWVVTDIGSWWCPRLRRPCRAIAVRYPPLGLSPMFQQSLTSTAKRPSPSGTRAVSRSRSYPSPLIPACPCRRPCTGQS